MKRKFKIEIEFVDNEAPEETDEKSKEALKDYLIRALGDLAFDIEKFEIS